MKNGFVYVATGLGYIDEARVSAKSLRTAMPSAHITLITDVSASADTLFDCVILRTDITHSPADKLLAPLAPYEKCILIDTDTHVCGDITDIFELLDSFDIAATHEHQRGWDYTLPGVPLAFSEYSTGLIAFKNDGNLSLFFSEWKNNYEKLKAEKNVKADQPSFRWTLFHSKLRIATLPSEYHFISFWPSYIMWKALVVHGRGNLREIAVEVNAKPGTRVFVPNLGVIECYRGRKHWIKQLARITYRGIRTLFHTPIDSSKLNPSQYWK